MKSLHFNRKTGLAEAASVLLFLEEIWAIHKEENLCSSIFIQERPF